MKIKVLHVLSRLDQGGVENFIINVYRKIDREKIEFDFALTSGEKSVFDDEVEQLGGKLFYFENAKTVRGIKDNFERILNKYGPFDVVHSHCYFFSGYLLWLARKNKVPIRIAHAHDVYKGQKYSLFRFAYEKIMRLLISVCATHKLGCSQAAIDFVFGKNDKKAKIVRNAIDINKYVFNPEIRANIRSSLHIKPYDIVIGHVGRFEKQKNHHFLISVFDIVLKHKKNFKLMMVGTGTLFDKEKSYARSMGIYQNTLFLGNRYNVNELMMAMDLFVFPSKYEGLGIVLVEAQASGLPCIIFNNLPDDTKAIGDMIILNKDSPVEWSNAILAHCKDERKNNILYLKNLGYGIENTVSDLTKIYSSRNL